METVAAKRKIEERGRDTPQRDAERKGIHGEGDEGEVQSEGQGGDEWRAGLHRMERWNRTVKKGVGQTDGLHEAMAVPYGQSREDGHREDGEAKPDAGLQEGPKRTVKPNTPNAYLLTAHRLCFGKKSSLPVATLEGDAVYCPQPSATRRPDRSEAR